MRERVTGIGLTLALLAALLFILPSVAGMSPAAARVSDESQFDSRRVAWIDLLAELGTPAVLHPNTEHG